MNITTENGQLVIDGENNVLKGCITVSSDVSNIIIKNLTIDNSN